jgi:hypothetical protein
MTVEKIIEEKLTKMSIEQKKKVLHLIFEIEKDYAKTVVSESNGALLNGKVVFTDDFDESLEEFMEYM